MKKSYKTGLFASALTAAALFVCSSAYAAHPSAAEGGFDTLVLKDANGVAIASPATAYSPRKTCGACHDYGSGDKYAHKTQGVIEGDNQIYWQTYDVHGYAHGAVVGRHSQQGRNEDYSMEMRSVYGDPYFTSSPGMFGKF